MIITHHHPDGSKTYDLVIDVDDATYDRVARLAAASGRSIDEQAKAMVEASSAKGSTHS